MERGQLSYFIGPGNNRELVERILLEREGWVEVSQYSRTNFRWCQTPRNFKYFLLDGSSVLNHFQHFYQLSDKTQLLTNLHEYCESQHINLYDFLPASFLIDFQDELCQKQLISFLNFYIKNCPRGQDTLQHKRMQLLARLRYSIISNIIYKKRYLTYRYCQFRMHDVFLGPQHDYLWLAKPNDLNRGRGIEIFSTIQQLQNIITGFQTGYDESQHAFGKLQSTRKKQITQRLPVATPSQVQSTKIIKPRQREVSVVRPVVKNRIKSNVDKKILRKTSSFVIQKYIQKPMLIDGRKFDIRVWALFTHNHQLYFFKQGYARTSCFTYSTASTNVFTHLTNNAVQSTCQNYSKFQSANQLSFQQLSLRFQEKGLKLDPAIKRMKELALICFKSVKNRLDPQSRRHCFEIFGFDYMIDELGKVWLIEINTNPCIQASGPLLSMLLPRMLDDAFRLTLDRIFNRTSGRRYPVKGYEDKVNMWQYLDTIQSKKHK